MKHTHLQGVSKKNLISGQPRSPADDHNTTVIIPRFPAFSGQPNEQESDDQDEQKPVVSGRERLKRHREEVAGKVSIPENWGNESLLNDWIDFSAFDTSLTSKKIFSARAALMADAGRLTFQRGNHMLTALH